MNVQTAVQEKQKKFRIKMTRSKSENPNQDIQDSSGASNASAEITESPYRTMGRAIRYVAVNTIERFTSIADYMDPMDSDIPYLVETPERIWCLDGWEMVEEAKTQGCETVKCDIEIVGAQSIPDLILRKMASRSRTRGGEALYPEIVRNTKNAAVMLMNSNENLILFGHGGRRYGESFTAVRENNVRKILATRLGKDDATINTHILHGQYITNETFDMLIRRRVTKDFFEKYNRENKRKLRAELEKEGLSVTDIATRISADMLVFLNEYEREHNETNIESPQSQEQVNAERSVTQIEADVEGDDETYGVDGQETEENDESDTEGQVSEVSMPALRESIRHTARRIEEAAADDADIDQLANCIRDEMINLQMILNRLNSLRTGNR